MARSHRTSSRRARPLHPGSSDVDLFRYGQRIVDLGPEISHRTKRTTSLCMYGDEKSATALRAGSITRNDTSQALLDAPSS